MMSSKSGEYATVAPIADSFADYCADEKSHASLTLEEWDQVKNDPEFAYWLDPESPNFRAGQRPKEWWLYDSPEPRNRLEGELQQLLRMKVLTPHECKLFGVV
jgi:hypothetical protein